MDDKILSAFISDIKAVIKEAISKNSEYESKLSEMKNDINEKETTIKDRNTTIDQLRETIAKLETEQQEKWKEIELLRDTLAKLQVKQRLADLDIALKDYTEDEKAYAKEEIEAFKKDPVNLELNSIINKIKSAAYDAMKKQRMSEQNNYSGDIFSEVGISGPDNSLFKSIF